MTSEVRISTSKNVHNDAIFVMNEIGIDISSNKTKSIESLDKDFVSKLDHVITLCAEEVCPIVPESTNTYIGQTKTR
ncbi:MAG: hypothetical protein CM15mP76_00500 [Prochlorococcus sp.]|nr:MAG: hypothetical protein CM15mP76_00500 [Prochlorococcus sp.]